MRSYLADLYVPQARAEMWDDAPRRAREAAAALTREGTPVNLVRSIDVPGDDLSLWLFEAESEDAVREAARRAGLEVDRVVPAVAEGEARPLEQVPGNHLEVRHG